MGVVLAQSQSEVKPIAIGASERRAKGTNRLEVDVDEASILTPYKQ
jgi:hypothetical protein